MKLTGDASELAERFQAPSKSERLCVAGSAKHSTRELLAALEHVSAQLPRQNTWFLGGGPDVFSNELVVRIENVDAGVLSMVRQAAGEGARVESFIELTEGSLADLPLPPPKGDIPLVTNPSRWSYGGMRALGFFTIRFDAAAGCVYFEDVKSERVLPIWPHGYAAYVEPFRVVDFDDHVVSNGERQTFGGGNVPLPDFDPRPPSCGAQAAWVGHPSVRAARAPDVPPRKGR